MNGIEHPLLREQVRDYFVNQQFRKDLYVRGATRLSITEQRQRLLDTRVVLLQAPETIALKITGALGEATLQPNVYEPLITALTGNQMAPITLRKLAQAMPANMSWAQLQQAVMVLVGMNAVAPCQSEGAVEQVQQHCAALNQKLCERAALGAEIETLASPLTGGGVAVGRFQQLFLLARRQGRKQPAEWAQYTWQLLQSQGQKLVKEGKTLKSAEENLAELTHQANEFAAQRLPVLQALQVV